MGTLSDERVVNVCAPSRLADKNEITSIIVFNKVCWCTGLVLIEVMKENHPIDFCETQQMAVEFS
jgi:hypothetical protein